MRRFPMMLGVGGLSLLTAACMVAPPPPAPLPPPIPGPGPGPGPALCDAGRASWAIGERASPSVLERATLDSGARSARVVHPGEAVTMEFNPTRLTIQVNEGNRIVDVRCG